jgi:hypothetical protein
MIHRNITAHIKAALSDSPVVLLNGARQSGKSTLVKKIASDIHPARYLTLDYAGVLAAELNKGRHGGQFSTIDKVKFDWPKMSNVEN